MGKDPSSNSKLMQIADVLRSLSLLAWPLLVLVVFFMLIGPIQEVISSRSFSVQVGDYKISVQEVTNQQSELIASIREDLDKLKLRTDVLFNKANVSESQPLSNKAQSVLWVDDHPSNNALLIQELNRANILVYTARTSSEAFNKLNKENYSYIITDMGRNEAENIEKNPQAGLDLIKQVRASSRSTPIILYSSRKDLFEEAKDAGASFTTNSGTELLRILGFGEK